MCMCDCMSDCVCVCDCVYMYICLYIYIYTYAVYNYISIVICSWNFLHVVQLNHGSCQRSTCFLHVPSTHVHRLLA